MKVRIQKAPIQNELRPISRQKKLFVFQFSALVFPYKEIEKVVVYVCQEMIYGKKRVKQFH